jgi:polysaccharide export outer membrane protein
LDLEDVGAQPIRIDMRGNINLPIVGRVQAAGRSVEELESELVGLFKRVLRDPTVIVAITEYRSQPISILGAVTKPGVYQIEGQKTLFEVLSLAEGLRVDAGSTIKITRRKRWGSIPLANAADDSTGEFSVAEVSVKSVVEARNPQENVRIFPNDVVSVPRADLVYVIGSVRRPGGFVLSEKETMSVLQALSLAEGIERTAAPQDARILRGSDGSAGRRGIPVDVKKVLEGKQPDVPLRGNDILFIPNSAAKSAAMRALEAAVQVGTGVVIYRR